jgi:hypothetical protein
LLTGITRGQGVRDALKSRLGTPPKSQRETRAPASAIIHSGFKTTPCRLDESQEISFGIFSKRPGIRANRFQCGTERQLLQSLAAA